MKTVLVHLSDLHISSRNDEIFSRVDKITAAISSVDVDADQLLIAITGDVTFSGKREQYEAAAYFVRVLREKLRNSVPHLSKNLRIVAVPGNHDWDRDLVDSPDGTGGTSCRNENDSSTLEGAGGFRQCPKSQSAFFDIFLNNSGGAENIRLAAEGGYGYYEYAFEGTRVLCLTTHLDDSARTPKYAAAIAEKIRKDNPQEKLCVAMTHYPLHWLHSEAARPVRERIEKVVDYVMTGHEHVEDLSITSRWKSNANVVYSDGGALSETDNATRSSFKVLVLTAGSTLRSFSSFTWDGVLYRRAEVSTRALPPFSGNPKRRRSEMEPKQEFANILSNVGMPLHHRLKAQVTLDDIFVYPELQQMDLETSECKSRIRGEETFATLCQATVSLVYAEELQGKTSLAKTVFKQFLKEGYVPILLSRKPWSTWDRTKKDILDAFAAQYGRNRTEEYEQLVPAKRVIIVDGFSFANGRHRSEPRREVKELINKVTAFASKCVLIAGAMDLDVSATVELAGGLRDGESFRLYEMLEFGYERRGALVDKWLALEGGMESIEEDLSARKRGLLRMFEAMIEGNVMPSFPIYVLAILATSEVGQPVDTKLSSHADCFDLVIKTALHTRKLINQYDTLATYLSELAYRLHEARKNEITHEELAAFNNRFAEVHDLRMNMGTVATDLKTALLMEEHEGGWTFKYRYLYYYFVAFYFKDKLARNEIREEVRRLSKLTYVEEAANILLFLTYFTKDEFLLECVVDAARQQLKDKPKATLDEDLFHLTDIGDIKGLLEVESGDLASREKKASEAKDRANPQRMTGKGAYVEGREIDALEAVDTISRINAAAKSMQITGQLLRNFPVSLDAEAKQKITRECIDLGLRLLSFLLECVSAERGEVLEVVVALLRNRYPDAAYEKIERKARHMIGGLTFVGSYAVIKRIAYDVGHKVLTVTYEKVASGNRTRAEELVFFLLKQENSKKYPSEAVREAWSKVRGRYLPELMLRVMVAQHFSQNDVEYNIRQSICGMLSITDKRARIGTSSRRNKRLGG